MLNAGLTLNKEKCVFGVDKVKYLGHVVDQEGIRADPDKTAAIQEMRPLTKFIGTMEIYRYGQPAWKILSKPCPNLSAT